MSVAGHISMRTLAGKALLLTAGMGAIVSCAAEMDSLSSCDATATDDATAADITLVITMDETSSTRADDETWADYDPKEDGTGYENKITSLQVVFTTTKGRAVSAEQTTLYVNSDGSAYQYTGRIHPDSIGIGDGETFSGTVAIFANCGYLASDALADTLSYDFSSPEEGGVRDDGIPMWGFQTFNQLELTNGYLVDIGTIDLLRAMARVKIEVDDSTRAQGYSIASAAITPYNRGGLCLPNYDSGATQTTDISVDGCLNIPEDVEASVDALAFVTADSAIVYVPEYSNTAEGATPATIALTLRHADDNATDSTAVTLYFKDYENGLAVDNTDYDIIRNHTYNYTAHREDSAVYISVSVGDWYAVSSSVGWEASAETTFLANDGSTGDATEGDADAVYSFLLYPRWGSDDESNTTTEDKQSYASYEFTIPADDGLGTVTWKAYLTNTEYFKFNTGSSDINDSEYNATTGISREAPYSIKVGPTTRWSSISESVGENYEFANFYTDTLYYVFYKDSTQTDTIHTLEPDTIDSDLYAGMETQTRLSSIYTDLFIIATGSGLLKAIDINPARDESIDGCFIPNWFPGGAGGERTVTADGETFTLDDNQWIRIYQTEADTTEYNSYGKLAKKISDESDGWWDPSQEPE